MDFYKIKTNMTKQHKKLMLDLKKIYEASLKDFKRQEAEAKDKVDDAVERFGKVQAEINWFDSIKEKLEKEIVGYKEELERLRSGIDKEREITNNQTEENKKRLDDIMKEILKMNAMRTEFAIYVEKEQAKLDKKRRECGEIYEKNKAVLATIKAEKASVEKIRGVLVKERADLAEAQHQHREKIKDDEAKYAKAAAIASKVVSKTQELDKRSREIINKEILQNKRTVELNEKEENLKDIGANLDLTTLSLEKRERRVQTLIEIHNLKGKM